jgi:site-specific recombinase XerD
MQITNLFKSKIDILHELDLLVKGIKTGTLNILENNKYAANTYYIYKSSVMHFREFLCNRIISDRDLNKELLDNFNKWLIDNNYSKNSVWNNAKCLRTLLNRLMEDKIIPKSDLGKMTIKKEETTAVYCTEEEINTLAALDLSLTEGLKRVRDLFVLQCYTGIRYSDLKKFMANPKAYVKHTDTISYMDITTVKTFQHIIIPLKPVVKKILEENNYKFGRPCSLQHYNQTLRKLMKYVGFDDDVVRIRTLGGERTEKVIKKYDLISSHTARRSFATNAYLAGLSSLQIRKITGHTTEESFLHYIRASGLENAVSLLNHSFFK